VLLSNAAAPVHVRTVRPPGTDRPARHREDPLLPPSSGPSGPRPRIVRAAAESPQSGTHLFNDWCPDQRQQLWYDSITLMD
jgi:hypothetical protein